MQYVCIIHVAIANCMLKKCKYCISKSSHCLILTSTLSLLYMQNCFTLFSLKPCDLSKRSKLYNRICQNNLADAFSLTEMVECSIKVY